LPLNHQCLNLIYQYDKHHLVPPFGEFVHPFGSNGILLSRNIPLADSTAALSASHACLARFQRIAPNICYEDLLPVKSLRQGLPTPLWRSTPHGRGH
jgi:apolipoprotein N-acyltransferase